MQALSLRDLMYPVRRDTVSTPQAYYTARNLVAKQEYCRNPFSAPNTSGTLLHPQHPIHLELLLPNLNYQGATIDVVLLLMAPPCSHSQEESHTDSCILPL